MPGPRRLRKRATGLLSSCGSKGCTSSMGVPATSRKMTWMARSASDSRERTTAPNRVSNRATIASASVTASEMWASPLGCTITSSSESLGRLEHAEHRAQAIRDLAQRGPRLDRAQDQGHEVLIGARAAFEGAQRALPPGGITPGAKRAQTLGALTLDARIGLEDVRR